MDLTEPITRRFDLQGKLVQVALGSRKGLAPKTTMENHGSEKVRETGFCMEILGMKSENWFMTGIRKFHGLYIPVFLLGRISSPIIQQRVAGSRSVTQMKHRSANIAGSICDVRNDTPPKHVTWEPKIKMMGLAKGDSGFKDGHVWYLC